LSRSFFRRLQAQLAFHNGHGYAPVDGSMLVYGTLMTAHTLDAGDNLGILPAQLVITLG
jgi:hypothetical protein